MELKAPQLPWRAFLFIGKFIMTKENSISKPFRRKQRETGISNDVYDFVMPHLSCPAWKVLTFIIRKTDGWQKEADKISYSQISLGCGLATATIKRAVDELQGIKVSKREKKFNFKLELIIAHKGKRGYGGRMQTTTYQINRDFEVTAAMRQSVVSKKDIALREELELIRKIEDGEV